MGADLTQILSDLLADPGCAALCGGFGAVAELMRDPGEPAQAGPGLQVVTARGGVRIVPVAGMVPLAYEMPGRRAGWTQALELCLPVSALEGPGRDVVTELGPDAGALRPEDRDAVLFDLGLALPHAAFCVRTAQVEALAVLRHACGLPLLSGPAAPAMPRLSPHRVVRSALGRVEVYQPIPPPDGPHAHLLPKLLAHGRTHAANLPVLRGLVPCLSLFPPDPLASGGFDRAGWQAFQVLLGRHADQDWLAAKRAAMEGRPVAAGRHAALAARVAARQAPFLT